MNKTPFWFFALPLALGCTSAFDNTDDDNDANDDESVYVDRTITVSWRFRDVDGTPVANCVDGSYGMVSVRAQGLSKELETGDGQAFEKLVPCGVGQTSITVRSGGPYQFPADAICNDYCGDNADNLGGLYNVSIFTTEASGLLEKLRAPVFDYSFEQVDVSQADAALSFDFWPTSGFLLYEWGLFPASSDGGGASAIGCLTANLDEVRVTAQLTHTADYEEIIDGPEYTDSYPCEGSEGAGNYGGGISLSRPLSPGYYNVYMVGIRDGVSATGEPSLAGTDERVIAGDSVGGFTVYESLIIEDL